MKSKHSLIPKLKIEMKSFSNHEIPFIIEAYFSRNSFWIDLEDIEGYLVFKDVNQETMDRVKSIRLEVTQSEQLGVTSQVHKNQSFRSRSMR